MPGDGTLRILEYIAGSLLFNVHMYMYIQYVYNFFG